MAREILFRGKRIDNGEWIEGYYLAYPDGKETIFRKCDSPPDGDPMWKKVLIEYEVKHDAVCQYTGLTDKNGKKIFEGDIVDCHEKRGAAFHRSEVTWNTIKARFDVIAMGCAFPMCLDEVVDDISVDGVDYKVIGNVFDNPELLRGT